MSGHWTPGPWVQDLNPADVRSPIGDVAVAVYAGMTPIAITGEESTLAPICRAEAEANARLMACAPELLSIAQRWAAIDGGAWDVVRHAREKSELKADTIDAIAKATGEQP